MAEDRTHFLNELTVWKLRAVADEYNIDVTQCKYKRDYVQKIASKKITEEQVRAALEKARKAKSEAPGEEEMEEIREIGREVEEIARKPALPTELPEEEDKSVERHIDEALMMRPSLFEVDSMTESAYNRMIVGDYYEAIKANRDARRKCLEGFSSFEVYSAAVSIRAAEELLAKMGDQTGEVEAGLRTALAAAKRTFISGPPRTREEALENLESLATKAYEAFTSKTEKDELELRALLADYEAFGTKTEEPRRYLEMAEQARQTFNVGEYAKLVNDARESAQRAKEARAAEINLMFPVVRAATAAAKEVGVDIAKAESELGEARRAFDEGAFRRAVELLLSVEQATDAAHLEQIRKQRELEARQLERIGASVAMYERTVLEASSYGFDVQEGMLHLANTKSALKKRDTVNAAKFAQRLKEIAAGVEKGLDQKRLELGVIRHIDGAKCGKCGRESLYLHPNSIQKCMECGHSFSVAPSGPEQVAAPEEQPPATARSSAVDTKPKQPEARDRRIRTLKSQTEKKEGEKKKRGLFRW
ncbi:MAG: hypothetical protein ACUVT7_07505 [Thermoplasmata archaeon]